MCQYTPPALPSISNTLNRTSMHRAAAPVAAWRAGGRACAGAAANVVIRRTTVGDVELL